MAQGEARARARTTQSDGKVPGQTLYMCLVQCPQWGRAGSETGKGDTGLRKVALELSLGLPLNGPRSHLREVRADLHCTYRFLQHSPSGA